MISSLDELETTLNAVTARLLALSDETSRLRAENARLRAALAAQTERMRAAGHKLRIVAERLPQPIADVAVDAVPEEKAA